MPDAVGTRTTDELRLLIDAISDYAIFLLDPQGQIRSWNTGAERIKGYRAEEIVGQHFSRFYTQRDIDRDHPAHELEIAAREGRYEEEGWRVRKDGTRFWANVVITALYDENRRLTGYGKVTRDLTERRLAEERLRLRSEELAVSNGRLEHFRLAIASIRDYAIFLLDAGGHVRTWNAGAEAVKGYQAEEIIGKHFSRFYTEDDLARNHPARELELAVREGRYEEEGWRLRKDGTRFWASVVITALVDDDGDLVGFAKVTRDLTQRRMQDERLRRTAEELERSNADLERFATAAAHDLAMPLHTIAGLADLVRVRHGDAVGDEGAESLLKIRDAAGLLRDRVDALLAYASATRNELSIRRIDVADVLTNVTGAIEALLSERGAVVEPGDDLGAVLADPRLLELVLQNLVTNAIKFNDGDAPRVRIAAEADGMLRRISVSDDGIGIAADDHARIFGLFNRAGAADAYAGTGMGLALCRQIVERHGGEIGVASEPGRGSTFWFTLPGG